jgi:hypothetical protein
MAIKVRYGKKKKKNLKAKKHHVCGSESTQLADRWQINTGGCVVQNL